MEHRHSGDISSSGTTQRGFTLVEGLVVLVLIGLAVVIAVPNLQRVRVQARTESATRELLRAVGIARNEALKSHTPMGVVVDTGGRRLQVFEDWDRGGADVATNNNGARDANENIVETVPLDTDLEFTTNPGGFDTKISTITWNNTGAPELLNLGDPTTGGSVWLRDTPGNVFRIRINGTTGSPSFEMWTGSGWSSNRENWKWKY